MSKRSSINTLPPAVKAWLDQALIEGNFSGYQVLEETLREQGYAISKSSIHRYGQDFEQRMQNLKIATEQAKAIVGSLDDQEDAMSEALMRLTQEKLFTILNQTIINADDDYDITKVAKAAAEISRASTNTKKYARQIREEERRKALEEAATTAEASMKQQGLSANAIDAIKRDILGILV
jgi:FKBP-type peptidyl-prolyl cis-trans isomerase